MEVHRDAPIHDVVIIGSGAAGGLAAWNLTRRGVNVLLLDAGPKFPQSPSCLRVSRNGDKQKHAAPIDLRLDVQEQPYLHAAGQPFDLVRVWGRGGKTNLWARVSLRYSDLDFLGPERDGWEIPWPIRYADIAPYYDRLDRMLGICGGTDDQDSLPGSRYHRTPPPLLCGEALLRKASSRLGLTMVRGRRAMARRPRYTGPIFNASDHLVEPALATGRLSIVENAVAGRILVDDRGRAAGVQYFGRHTKEERQVRARVVVVAASCIDSTRLLLNSRCRRYPNGIGNSNDVIGRYLCEQVRFHLHGLLPELMGGSTMSHGVGQDDQIYLPRFNHRDGRARDYLRGFGMQFWGCGPRPDAAFAKALPGFGASFKASVKRKYPALVSVHPYGEVLPRRENRVTVDGTPVDRYGLPIARIEFTIGENERRMIREMYDVAEAILLSAKAEILPFTRHDVDVAGSVIHEHGTCRMGHDATRAAVNRFCQSHEVPNLFVVDGSVFPTATEKNPTLTILALAWRATDYLTGELRAGRL